MITLCVTVELSECMYDSVHTMCLELKYCTVIVCVPVVMMCP